jgi:hypothetical protein
MSNVSREKYEKLKSIMNKWSDKSYEIQEKLDISKKTVLELEKINSDVVVENESLKKELNSIEECNEKKYGSGIVEGLELEIKQQKSLIKDMKKTMIVNEYDSKRDIMMKDGKIQQLEDARNYSNERFKEARDDLRWEKENSRGIDTKK